MTVALLGLAVSAPSWVLLIAAFCAGFCISGGQNSVIALAAIFYPAPIRSTGVGWALGIGRLGGIGGPLLIGVLMAHQLSAASLFYAAAVPMRRQPTLKCVKVRQVQAEHQPKNKRSEHSVGLK